MIPFIYQELEQATNGRTDWFLDTGIARMRSGPAAKRSATGICSAYLFFSVQCTCTRPITIIVYIVVYDIIRRHYIISKDVEQWASTSPFSSEGCSTAFVIWRRSMTSTWYLVMCHQWFHTSCVFSWSVKVLQLKKLVNSPFHRRAMECGGCVNLMNMTSRLGYIIPPSWGTLLLLSMGI